MSKILEQAHDVVPGTPYARDTTTTADGERLEIPADMDDKFCVFHATGEQTYIRFGDGTVDVDPAATSTVVAEAITVAGPKVPHVIIPANTVVHVRIPGGLFTHLAHISDATGGVLNFGPRTGTGTDDDN